MVVVDQLTCNNTHSITCIPSPPHTCIPFPLRPPSVPPQPPPTHLHAGLFHSFLFPVLLFLPRCITVFSIRVPVALCQHFIPRKREGRECMCCHAQREGSAFPMAFPFLCVSATQLFRVVLQSHRAPSLHHHSHHHSHHHYITTL